MEIFLAIFLLNEKVNLNKGDWCPLRKTENVIHFCFTKKFVYFIQK